MAPSIRIQTAGRHVRCFAGHFLLQSQRVLHLGSWREDRSCDCDDDYCSDDDDDDDDDDILYDDYCCYCDILLQQNDSYDECHARLQ